VLGLSVYPTVPARPEVEDDAVVVLHMGGFRFGELKALPETFRPRSRVELRLADYSEAEWGSTTATSGCGAPTDYIVDPPTLL